MEDLTGRELRGCRILERLGRGAMGAVYRAHQASLGRDVAIKVVLREALAASDDSEVLVRRFEREAHAVAALNHPNVMAIHDYGQEDDLVFMVMELIRGRSLAEHIREGRRFTPQEVMELGAQAARGLAAAHRAGIIHRDVKPDNLMLTDDGVVKVTDFGLAKEVETDVHLTRTQVIVGSPAYMSPEQCQGEELTPATDLYSLGITLYSALTGHCPFEASTAVGVMLRHVSESVVYPPELRRQCSRELLAVLDRALAKVPAERFASSDQMAAVLERVRAGGKLNAEEHPVSGEFASRRVIDARSRWLWPAVAAVAVLVVGLVALVALGNGEQPAPPEVAGEPAPPTPSPSPADQPALPPAPAPQPEPEDGTPPPDPDLSAQVREALAHESRLELQEARELLDAVAGQGDLEAISPEAAATLTRLRRYEEALATGRRAIEEGDLEAALLAIEGAHAVYRTPETTRLLTDLRLVHRRTGEILDLVRAGDLSEAQALLQQEAAGAHARMFEALGVAVDGHAQTMATARAALEGEEWRGARDALELACQYLETPTARRQLEALQSYQAALAAGDEALARGDYPAALVVFVEARGHIDSEEVQGRILEARFAMARAKVDQVPTPEAKLQAIEEALALRPDAELEQQAEQLRLQLQPSDADLVEEALGQAEQQLEAGEHQAALATLTGVEAKLPAVTEELRARHALLLVKLRQAQAPRPVQPRPPQRVTIAAANQLLSEADKLRKTPLTLFSDRNERRALSLYEQLIQRYPNSDRIGDAYYGAGHVAQNLELDQKAVTYWTLAAQTGYPDPIECYLLAADLAEDELEDRSKARALLRQALNICHDGRRAAIQRQLDDLR
jgi:serine/threonine-protein kinase